MTHNDAYINIHLAGRGWGVYRKYKHDGFTVPFKVLSLCHVNYLLDRCSDGGNNSSSSSSRRRCRPGLWEGRRRGQTNERSSTDHPTIHRAANWAVQPFVANTQGLAGSSAMFGIGASVQGSEWNPPKEEALAALLLLLLTVEPVHAAATVAAATRFNCDSSRSLSNSGRHPKRPIDYNRHKRELAKRSIWLDSA